MEEKKFKNISFSLRQNFLYPAEIETLVKISAISFVAHFFNDPDIKKDLKSLLPSYRPFTLLNIAINNAQQNIIRKIFRIINHFYPNIKEVKIFYLLIRSTIHSVVPQVCNFIVASRIDSIEDLNIMMKNVVLTDQETVSTETTLQRVVISDQIPTKSKFSVAVRFFLGYDYVEKFYNELSETEKSSINQRLKRKDNYCLYFWMWQITGSREKLKTKINGHIISESGEHRVCESDENDDVVLQHIFQKAVQHHNEMAVQYLWNKFISHMRERELILNDLLRRYMKRLEHTNIIMYLLFQVSITELTDYFTKFGFHVIERIIFKPRWKKVFFKIFDILKPYVRDDQFEKLLRRITTMYYCKGSLDINMDFILEIFDKIPISVKQNLVKETETSKHNYKELLLQTFELARIDLAKLFITHCNRENVLNFFFSSHGLELIEASILKKHFEFIDTIMKEITTSDDEIYRIKYALFDSKAASLAKKLIYNYDLEIFDIFLNWCSDSVPRMGILFFKKNLPYINKGEIIRDLLFHPIKNKKHERFKYTNEVLNYCLQNKRNVEMVTEHILLHVHEDDSYHEFKIACYKQVRNFVLRHEWVYLRTLIIWIKYSTARKRALGEKLLNDESLLKEMCKQKDAYDTLQSFVCWLQESLSIRRYDGIHAFKLKILDHHLLSNFVLKGKYREVKNLVAWCNPSPKHLQKFKNMTFLRLSEISDMACSDDLLDFLRWLDPSAPTLLVARSFHFTAVRNTYYSNDFIRSRLFRFISNLTSKL